MPLINNTAWHYSWMINVGYKKDNSMIFKILLVTGMALLILKAVIFCKKLIHERKELNELFH